MRFAEDLATRKQLHAALSFVNLNLEHFPQSSRSFVLRAATLNELGDISSARRDYRTALEIAPDSRWIKAQLDKLN